MVSEFIEISIWTIHNHQNLLIKTTVYSYINIVIQITSALTSSFVIRFSILTPTMSSSSCFNRSSVTRLLTALASPISQILISVNPEITSTQKSNMPKINCQNKTQPYLKLRLRLDTGATWLRDSPYHPKQTFQPLLDMLLKKLILWTDTHWTHLIKIT